MNKPCNNCKKEIHYYAGFCNHCETIQLRNEPKYTETKIGKVKQAWFGSPIKIEKMPNNTIIKREYDNSFAHGNTLKITESWLDMNKNHISLEENIDYDSIYYYQKWDGKSKELHDFNISLIKYIKNESEVSNWYKNSDDSFANFRDLEKCVYHYDFTYDMLRYKRVRIGRLDTERVDTCGFNKDTKYYHGSNQIMYTIKEGNYRTVKDVSGVSRTGKMSGADLIIAEFFNPDGTYIGKIDKPHSFVFLKYDQDAKLITHINVPSPELRYGYINENGFFNQEILNSWDISSTYEKLLFKYEKNEEKIISSLRSEKEYNRWLELKNSFNPTQYEKKCSECFESVKLPAKICHYCRKQFSEVEIQDAIDDKFNELHPKP